LTDAKIIDAYERAYTIAQAVGADHRQPEMPPMCDRQAMARRVRGYVLAGNRAAGSSFTGGTSGVGARERKALATMGRKGGKKAAQRWNERNSTYAQNELNKLAQANKQRVLRGNNTRGWVLAIYSQTLLETGKALSAREIASEIGCERSTVAKHVGALKRSGIISG